MTERKNKQPPFPIDSFRAMRNSVLLFISLFLCFSSIGQKEDYTWLSGYEQGGGYDTLWHHYYGINVLNFNSSPRQVTFDSTIGLNFAQTNINYSDTGGNLLFYSNGIEIRNRWDEIISNSYPMNNGWLINVFDPTIASNGLRFPQADIALPIPDTTDQFILFQCFVDSTAGQTGIYVPKLNTTYLSMSQNLGHGIVLFKDSLLIKDTLNFCISACRHANGRDWWILAQKENSNCFYRILLTKNGVQVMPDMTCTGTVTQYGDIGACCFSADGSKFAQINIYGGLLLYNFDRCSGTLSDAYNYLIPQLADSGWILNGVAFSPNSRYLYASITEYILQFDTWQSNPLSNPDTVGRFDGFVDPFGVYYCQSQLAPDGKIYLGTTSSVGDYSVIDSPNAQGSACQFLPHGLSLPAFQLGMPISPNYRLGALRGSSCDTLTGIRPLNNIGTVKVYPNPSQDVITVDYGSVDWSIYERLSLKVKDITGQELYSSDLPRFSAIHRVNISTYAPGMYMMEIQDDEGAVLAVKKWVKE